MAEGWIKLHRQICENPLWTVEKFTPAQAWVDLILNANHADGYFTVRGNRVDVKRGQIGWSEVTMSTRWKWSRTRVRNFLKTLEKEQQIEQQKNSLTTIITILNYEKYQGEEQQIEQQSGQQKNSRKTAEEQQKNINKNDKNDKNDKKKEINICKSFSQDKIKYAELVYLKSGEHEKLIEKYITQGGRQFVEKCIEKLDAYKGQSPKNRDRYSDDYRAIINWVADEVAKKNNQTQNRKTVPIYSGTDYEKILGWDKM